MSPRVYRTKLTEDHLAWLRDLDATGVPRREIARRFTKETGIEISVHRLNQLLRREPGTQGAPVKTLERPIRADVRLEEADLVAVRQIARDLGYVISYGRNAGDGHISGLLTAIARGDVIVRMAR